VRRLAAWSRRRKPRGRGGTIKVKGQREKRKMENERRKEIKFFTHHFLPVFSASSAVKKG
jgi:hypothetical protein